MNVYKKGFTPLENTPSFSHLTKKRKSLTGFTLMELLVVISIIGLLASVVLSSLNTARAKARDSKRISELRQMQNALALYFSEHGSYPYINAASGAYRLHDMENTGSNIISPKYISALPRDPRNTTTPCDGTCSTLINEYRYVPTLAGGALVCDTPAESGLCKGYILATKLEAAGVSGCYFLDEPFSITNTTFAAWAPPAPAQYGNSFVPCSDI